MLDRTALLALLLALAAVVVLLFAAPQLLLTPWGKRVLLFGAALLPLVASAGSFDAGLAESSRTRFCLSCHEMKDYGKSLFADGSKALSAAHFQNRLVAREDACYGCHTDYALFGDVKAKLNGLRHVYVHYLGEVPARPALYQPYPNRNCLHCHEDARRYLEQPAHGPVAPRLASGELSCLGCHRTGHDHAAVAAGRFWQAPAGAP